MKVRLSVHRKNLGDWLFVNIVEIGIRECEVIQWFVQSGARVEQFDKLCEVQSDKASVEVCEQFTSEVPFLLVLAEKKIFHVIHPSQLLKQA